MQLQPACFELANLRKAISDTLLMNENDRRERRAAPFLAFGPLTALNSGGEDLALLVLSLLEAEAAVVMEMTSITP